MEVKVGVQHAPRELAIECVMTSSELETAVEDALSGASAVLTLVDERGRKLIVPAAKIAYIEIGEPEARRVGFGAL